MESVTCDIQIATQSSSIGVRVGAKVYGGVLAIHQPIARDIHSKPQGGWRVTHVATGHGVPYRFADEAEARRFVEAALAPERNLDWSFTHISGLTKAHKAFGRNILEKMRTGS